MTRKSTMDLFNAIEFGRDVAAAGWSWEKTEAYLENSNYGRLTKQRVLRSYNEQLNRDNGHKIFRGPQARNGGMDA